MKMFRALTDAVCEKQFGPELARGWFATTQEAINEYGKETHAGSVAESQAQAPSEPGEDELAPIPTGVAPRTKRPYNRKKAA